MEEFTPCCGEFKNHVSLEYLVYEEISKHWNIEDSFGSVILLNIKHCPFCGERLESK